MDFHYVNSLLTLTYLICLFIFNLFLSLYAMRWSVIWLMSNVQVLYLIEAVDEYCIQSLPEFEGKKFQNAAKEGFKLDATEKAKERKEELEKEFEPLLKWIKDDALKDKVEIRSYDNKFK